MSAKPPLLTIADHARNLAGRRYVYPVLSRRAGGVSLGINLNPNNACNWHCIYCQVPDLARGGPPPVDLPLLESELAGLLDEVQAGRFVTAGVPADQGRLVDVAFSGNGEPTASDEFPAAVALAVAALERRGLAGKVKLRLITNGSLVDRSSARRGIDLLGRAGGEVWFKVDAGDPAGALRVNGVRLRMDSLLRRLRACAESCPTWAQTCLFVLDGRPPAEADLQTLAALLGQAQASISGVHLYSLARPSLQEAAARLERLPLFQLEAFAQRLRAMGLKVRVSP